MARNRKYTEEYIEKVEFLMNNQGMKKTEAIKKAGFSDTSCFYLALKYYGRREIVSFPRTPKVRKSIFL